MHLLRGKPTRARLALPYSLHLLTTSTSIAHSSRLRCFCDVTRRVDKSGVWRARCPPHHYVGLLCSAWPSTNCRHEADRVHSVTCSNHTETLAIRTGIARSNCVAQNRHIGVALLLCHVFQVIFFGCSDIEVCVCVCV